MKNSTHILVTGGAGYIGSHTVIELVEAGYRVTVIDNLERSDYKTIEGIEAITKSKIDFHKLDCLDSSAMESLFSKNSFSAVIHFAAFKSVNESVAQPIAYYKNNVGSLITLLEVMKKHQVVDLVFSSSCTVYGQPDSIPVDESAPFKRAESPYGATKQICERILEDAATTGFRIISLRYFNPIGAHPSVLIGELPIGIPNNLVPYITQTAAGLREKLIVFGNDYNTPDGTCLRDFIHVLDVASAHVKAIQYVGQRKDENVFEAFNLGTGIGVSVLELVKKFIKVTGVNVPYTIGSRRPGDIEKVYADPKKINKAFGWEAKYGLEESLLHSWKWEKKLRGKD
ncbi:MAG: UDP-glucose 4-epimerase GalE [Bacteroidota bacterium]